MKQVLIPLEEYKRLVGRDIELRQLESTGIDNWTNLPLTSAILYGRDGRKEIKDAQEECEKHIYPYKLDNVQKIMEKKVWKDTLK